MFIKLTQSCEEHLAVTLTNTTMRRGCIQVLITVRRWNMKRSLREKKCVRFIGGRSHVTLARFHFVSHFSKHYLARYLGVSPLVNIIPMDDYNDKKTHTLFYFITFDYI